jgi:hypothetical protein
MRFLGQLQNGVQEDPYANISPELIQAHLGVDIVGEDQIEGTTGAGASPEDVYVQTTGEPQTEDDTDTSNLSPQEMEILNFLRQQLRNEQDKHVRHPPVSVPAQQYPFGAVDIQQIFEDAFSVAQEDGFLPAGYGIRETEWEEDRYPAEQYIGSERTKHDPSLYIPLPYHIWYPRAVRWAVGLHIMNSVAQLDD